MSALSSLILFCIGFFVLITGARLLIHGATSVAHYFAVSAWFIGLIIVGVGTSIPELSINLAAAFDGNTVGFATIVGSNIFTMLFVLGSVAIARPVSIRTSWVFSDFPITICSVLVVLASVLLPLAGPVNFIGISRGEGILLTSLFGAWLWYELTRRQSIEDPVDYRVFTVFTSILMIVFGIAGVFVGGTWIVQGAEVIAVLIGMPPALVGLTVVAIGTSVPELAVSSVAVAQGKTSVAVGNIIGSNVFTFIGVIGLTTAIQPLAEVDALTNDLLVALAGSITAWLLLFIGRRYTYSRIDGAVLVGAYLAYLALLFLR
jgi:cation:H+ antiporter